MTARRQVAFWLAGMAVFGLLLFLLADILLPFVAGMAVAYLLDPIADRLESWGLSRTMATVVITVLFMVVTLGALFLLLPVLYNQALDLIGRAPAIAGALRDYFLSLSEGLFESLDELPLHGSWFCHDVFSLSQVGFGVHRHVSTSASGRSN